MKVLFKKEGIGNQWLVDMVKDMNAKLPGKIELRDNKVIFPENIARGTCSYHQLSERLDLCIFNLAFNTPLWIERTATEDSRYYSMHINCSPSEISHFAEGKESKIGGTVNSSIFWSASDLSSSFKIEKGQTFQAIIIYMSNEFLQEALGEETAQKSSIENGKNLCHLNDTITMRHLTEQKHFISRSLQTGIGRLKYELVQEILNFDKKSSISEMFLLKVNILKIFALFIKRVANKSSRDETSGRHCDASRILEIKKIIDENAGSEPMSLDELAKNAAMSKTKLKTKFKEIVGTTTYQYYLDVKMEKARSILEDCPIPISDVAYELGFKSTSHFSQAFKKHYGVSPKSVASKN
ncbi:helix-turn-helix transcriptional regulator [Pinibacter aurantiacus]|uniref:AraC family transcriptional regulator n=1 Tax=Pinibacter aurantiacus TaxID=2851599 RepID=A0A9E2SEZ3_9BACT|nr:AraC family transcriptional regulator [Pinibacter aurantiacus]MBV4360073.1 AraC family transcriptional regulator [Pinibacter aurantiacus]